MFANFAYSFAFLVSVKPLWSVFFHFLSVFCFLAVFQFAQCFPFFSEFLFLVGVAKIMNRNLRS